MVLPKNTGFNNAAWPDMCDDVTTIVRSEMNMPDIPIHCLPYDGSRTVEEEILLMQQATFIIAEHGTISFIPLYAHDGAVLVSVGTKHKLKNGQNLPYVTHLEVIFSAVEERASMANLFRFGLYRAADNFNIPFEG